jgi:hypothetical protein
MSSRTDALFFALLAVLAFCSVPAVWIHLASTGHTAHQIEFHPVGSWVLWHWPLAFSVPAHFTVFCWLWDKRAADVWRPVLRSNLVIIAPTLLLAQFLFYVTFLGLLLPMIIIIAALLLWWFPNAIRWIIGRWDADILPMTGRPAEQAALFFLAVTPTLMTVTGDGMHAEFLNTWP